MKKAIRILGIIVFVVITLIVLILAIVFSCIGDLSAWTFWGIFLIICCLIVLLWIKRKPKVFLPEPIQSTAQNEFVKGTHVLAPDLSSTVESTLLSTMTSNTARDYRTTEYEKVFFATLEQEIRNRGLNLSEFSLNRMSTGSIRLTHHACSVGTVHLRRHIGSIQYSLDPLDIHDLKDAPIESIITIIPYWIDYVIKCIRLHKDILC